MHYIRGIDPEDHSRPPRFVQPYQPACYDVIADDMKLYKEVRLGARPVRLSQGSRCSDHRVQMLCKDE